MAWLTPGTALTTPSCTDICVVKTASPFHLGDARKIPEEPLARFDTAMKQSFGSAPNFSLNSAFVHSLMWPAPSVERRPRSPENSLPAWPKESYKDQIDFLFVTSQSSILLLTLPPKM